MITIDGRCFCSRCVGRTENIYRMVGQCSNCGFAPLLMLFRAGDPTAFLDCPVCKNFHAAHAFRLATPDEIPTMPTVGPLLTGAAETKGEG